MFGYTKLARQLYDENLKGCVENIVYEKLPEIVRNCGF